ncbi:MAG: ISL3 family transposase [Candidatus Thiodiazotropha lotti]|uniref:ISL3 family transposase n=1 Tax=Candidatus Thiodiazotropha lotti TaxID=2792787 RepID=A0A9E4K9L1_9GAMM|nr:ISL3 family transposase [Candidatus Thiodiazotropha lotti]MCU7894125.1 ISL3 family transposase [Candidatus Thiodiazotropha sp. (ex Lucinoma aequizonata)]MCW4205842.1 ISL3 family transposase [Candidatus Thiodiazotropha lotti]
MQLKTILNRVQKFKSFVYGTVRWAETAHEPTIEAELRPRRGSRPVCSGCGRRRPGYDTLPQRRFEFIPMWGIKVFFLYAPRRVDCPSCGVRVERMPWAQGKHRLTEAYAWFLASWARRLSWKEVAEAFRTSWDHVFHSVEMAVSWGRAHQDLSGIEAIGIDEIQWQRGHRYLTLVYQIDASCRRLLWVGRRRKEKTLLRFFRWFGEERTEELRYVCSDMWKPYLKVIAKKAGQAIHILDRFHIMAHLSKAIDEVRAGETKDLKEKGYEPVLTKSRWLLLKRPENLTEKQESKLVDLLKYNLRSVRAYLLKEEFQIFWTYQSPYWAGKFLDKWCTKTMRSKIEPMKKVARMLRNHRPLLLNWFRAKGQFSSGIVEGFNNKAKLTTRRAYGFKTYHAAEIALYHALGALPVPETAHEFF